MKIKQIVDTDFVNYKKPSMFILFPYCTFKCDKENGCAVCQNSILANQPTHTIAMETIFDLYSRNPITKAIVCGGLEPMDSFDEVWSLLSYFRHHCADDFVIYTGYKEEEIKDKLEILELYENVIVKFGRFIPNDTPHFDDILGINLASNNQYAKYIGDKIG